ncbi:hypothetical protein QYF36_023628 [Acer negundo]|nr:hypothetical protein QYF36_023628 [Acer negundo]
MKEEGDAVEWAWIEDFMELQKDALHDLNSHEFLGVGSYEANSRKVGAPSFIISGRAKFGVDLGGHSKLGLHRSNNKEKELVFCWRMSVGAGKARMMKEELVTTHLHLEKKKETERRTHHAYLNSREGMS